MTIVDRRQAMLEGIRRYFTGVPCRKGHIAERNTKNRECIQCSLERSAADPNKAERTRRSQGRNKAKRAASAAATYRSDPSAALAYLKAHRLKNIDRYKTKERAARERSREQRKEYAKTRYRTDPEAVKEASRRWARKNRAKVAARSARRKAAKLRATPPWVDHSAIIVFYEHAAALTLATGVPHEVDHIHPLQGENFCGLHVPWNLQILTKSENSRKKNRLIDAALGESDA